MNFVCEEQATRSEGVFISRKLALQLHGLEGNKLSGGPVKCPSVSAINSFPLPLSRRAECLASRCGGISGAHHTHFLHHHGVSKSQILRGMGMAVAIHTLQNCVC